MKSILVIFFATVLATLARADTNDLEFSGVIVSNQKTDVLIMEKSTGNGRWLAVGQKFAGYTLSAYDPKTNRLTLTKGEEVRVLVLKSAPVQGAEASKPSTAEQQAIMNNLRQLSAAADQYYLEYGENNVVSGKLIGTDPKAYIKELKPVAGENYLNLKLKQGEPIRVKTAGGFEMEYRN